MIGLLAALLVPGMLFPCEAHDTVEMHLGGTENHNEMDSCPSGTNCGMGCLSDMCGLNEVQSTENSCSRAGVWKNELTSFMRITCSDGEIRGMYCSAVGRVTSFYQLSGRYLVATDNTVIMGWTVAWQNGVRNSQSSTSWSAISYTDDVIESQWLLTFYNKELWNTVTTNRDRFSKVTC